MLGQHVSTQAPSPFQNLPKRQKQDSDSGHCCPLHAYSFRVYVQTLDLSFLISSYIYWVVV